MHNAAIRALGLDAVYVALPTPTDKLPVVLDALAAVGAAGNVTVPHKEAVERYIARKTDVCARAGACNTFWTEGGALVGDNTDVPGVATCVKRLADGAGRGSRRGAAGALTRGRAGARLRRLGGDARRAGARGHGPGYERSGDQRHPAGPQGEGSVAHRARRPAGGPGRARYGLRPRRDALGPRAARRGRHRAR